MRIRCPNCHHGLEIVAELPAELITCPSCGSRLDPTSGETATYRPETRRKIGHFELLEHVGRGHFGNVWRARDTELQRVVAVKIPRTADFSKTDQQLFLREAQTAAKLRHPNIVTVHAVEHDGDDLFIVSDFIQGVTLAEQLHIRKPTFEEAARWCAEVADALDYAHQQGVIHRDMKPGNVMLEGTGKPYVLDFGLAKHEASEITITAAGEILGTPAYMSPEQARGQASSADRRSDVYSLGVLLYELLTGQRPFQGGTRSLMHQILNEEPKPPRKLSRDVPLDLETICLRAMAKDPNHRYITAKEMADDLRRYLAGEPIHARPVRWYERSYRWAKRNPALSAASGIAAAAVVLLALVVGRSLIFTSPAVAALGDVPRNVQISVRKWKEAIPSDETDPAPSALVVFWRMDSQTGDFDLEHPVQAAGASPLTLKLLPGDYLVVAQIKDFGFHEVFRHVTVEGEVTNSYKHQSSVVQADGSILLSDIAVPPPAASAGMVPVPSATKLRMGTGQPDAPHRLVRVASFLMDRRETTVGDLKLISWTPAAAVLQGKAVPLGTAAHSMSWNEATAYAERIGKRLPDELEFESAATNGGATRFPWGDDSALVKEWPLGNAGTPSFDRATSAPSLENLYSNLAEWTSSWGAPYPVDRTKLDLSQVRFERVVRGAPIGVIAGQPLDPGEPVDPRIRQMMDYRISKPTVGFRCARSAAPRLKAADFSRDLPNP